LNAARTSSGSNAAPPIHPGFGTLFESVIAIFPFVLRYLPALTKEKWVRGHVPIRLVLVRLPHQICHPLLGRVRRIRHTTQMDFIDFFLIHLTLLAILAWYFFYFSNLEPDLRQIRARSAPDLRRICTQVDIISFFLITRIRHITQMDFIEFFVTQVIYTRARKIRIRRHRERDYSLPLCIR
jgi:hypothetical protein